MKENMFSETYSYRCVVHIVSLILFLSTGAVVSVCLEKLFFAIVDILSRENHHRPDVRQEAH